MVRPTIPVGTGITGSVFRNPGEAGECHSRCKWDKAVVQGDVGRKESPLWPAQRETPSTSLRPGPVMNSSAHTPLTTSKPKDSAMKMQTKVVKKKKSKAEFIQPLPYSLGPYYPISIQSRMHRTSIQHKPRDGGLCEISGSRQFPAVSALS